MTSGPGTPAVDSWGPIIGEAYAGNGRPGPPLPLVPIHSGVLPVTPALPAPPPPPPMFPSGLPLTEPPTFPY